MYHRLSEEYDQAEVLEITRQIVIASRRVFLD